MHYRKIFIILLTICIIPVSSIAQADSLISRCRSALKLNIEIKNTRDTLTRLIDEIERKEDLYLKSALYPEVRRHYEKLQVKLGEYYFKNGDFQEALDFYIKADQYSETGYKDKIALCRESIKKITLTDCQNDIIKFMDRMFQLVKDDSLADPYSQALFRDLVSSPLNGPEFLDITTEYKRHIPGTYDALINQFFHVIYVRKPGWTEKAEVIISVGGWEAPIENKMREILKKIE